MAVRVQKQDFDIGAEVANLRKSNPNIGALVTFSGIVRNRADGSLVALELEHYDGMTQSALQQIEQQAQSRWPLQSSLIIHRYGRLLIGDNIMMVATASAHRAPAFEAAEFLMDYLKSKAPFWKKEHLSDGSNWVSAQDLDLKALNRWK